MKKSVSLLLSLSILLSAGSWSQADAAGQNGGDHTLVMFVNKPSVSLDGVTYPAAQPTVVVGGTTYAPLSMLAARFEYKLGYAAATKESYVMVDDHKISWKAGVSSYTIDGQATKIAGAPFVKNGSLMIPVRAWATATGAVLTAGKNQLSLSWNTVQQPTADFTVDIADPKETSVYATQTKVVYTSHSANAKYITDERWEGKEEVFAEPGEHTITRWVQGPDGEWSEPYSVTVNVLPANQPPQALFVMDKDTYMIGEPIQYTDQSTDDENAIASTEWSNNKPAFFTPGDQTINLRVTDKHGLISDYMKTIHISTDVMYTEQQFNQKFTPVGERYDMNGSAVLGYSLVPYTYNVSDRMLMASDSPEDILKEGILYRDTMDRDFRLFLYHQNLSNDTLKLYLAATNEGTEPATVSLGSFGQAGPSVFGLWTGKQAAARYLESKQAGETTLTTLAPGETRLIMPQLGDQPLKKTDVYSAYIDLSVTSPVKFTLFAMKQDGRKPLDVFNTYGFGVLNRDGKHIRGTFEGADREVTINQVLGQTPQRVLFGDHVNDHALDGRDMLNGIYENNWGNYGVVYHMNVQVAPNTLIAVNGRGGVYSGVFRVNGDAVMVTNSSLLQNSNQASVLYRTGSTTETVDISFLTALGSNLPMNLLFIPMN